MIDDINNVDKLSKEELLQKLEQSDNIETVRFILEKTSVLNSQLNKRESAEIVWNNVVLLRELNILQEEKIKARLTGNFDLEKRLIERVKQIESSVQKMQMEFIQK